MSIQLPPSGKPGTSPQGKAAANSAEATLSRAQSELAKLVGQSSKAQVLSVANRTSDTALNATGRLANQQAGNLRQSSQQQAQLRADQTTQNTMDTLLKLNGPGNASQFKQTESMPYQATLRIGQLQFSVASPVALTVGEEILLKILSSRELSLLGTVDTKQQQSAPTTSSTLQSALRVLLPRLTDQSRLLEVIQRLQPAQLQSLSAQSQSAIAGLRQLSLPLDNLNQLLDTPAGQARVANSIRQALQNSGVFQQHATTLSNKLIDTGSAKDAALAKLVQSPVGNTAMANTSALPQSIRQSIASWVQDKSPFRNIPADAKATLAETAAKNPQALLKQSQQTSTPQASGQQPESTENLKSGVKELSQQLLAELLAITTSSQTSRTELSKLPGDLPSQLRRAAEILRQQNSTATTAKTKIPAAQREQTLLMLILLRESLSSLVRTQLHQLTSLNAQQQAPEAQQQNHWFTELPIQLGEHTRHVQIQLEEESNQQQHQGQRQWKVMLRFDLEKLGTLFVRLILVGETVKTTLWTQNDLSRRFIRRQLDELERGLKKVGVNVEQIECLCGTPPDPRVQIQQSLIDIKT